MVFLHTKTPAVVTPRKPYLPFSRCGVFPTTRAADDRFIWRATAGHTEVTYIADFPESRGDAHTAADDTAGVSKPSTLSSALVVVDLQNFFITEHTQDLPARIVALLGERRFNPVLFTKFVSRADSNFVRQLGWRRCMASPDIDLHPALAPFVTAENVFEKTSYSIFKAKGLPEYLTTRHVEDLYLCGTDIDACILASAFDAFDLGLRLSVLREYSMSHSGLLFEQAAGLIMDKCFKGLFPD